MNPTWYDVLGVDRGTSAEHIKSAWRRATDDLEPGSDTGRFRRLNEAADVLLDPTRRAAYDATLDREARTEERQAQRTLARAERRAKGSSAPGSAALAADEPTDEPVSSARRPGSPLLVAAVGALAVLTILALVFAVVLGSKHREQNATDAARTEAQATADRALTTVLSYDYRHLPADRTAAEQFLTPAYRTQYDRTYRLLSLGKTGQPPGPVVTTKTVVTANVVGMSVVDANPSTVRVLAYVDQSTSKAGGTPQIFQNRVAATLVKQGDAWLVDNLASY